MHNTIQKEKIYKMLTENANSHLTADDMLDLLNKEKENVSRATLYRYLDVLVSNGAVRKYVLSGNEKACYQLVENSNCKEHFHLVCSKCGKLIHLSCERIDDLIHHIEEDHKFKVDLSKVVFNGLCEDCLKEDDNVR